MIAISAWRAAERTYRIERPRRWLDGQAVRNDKRIGVSVCCYSSKLVHTQTFRRYVRLSIFDQPRVFRDVMIHVKPAPNAESSKLSPHAVADGRCAKFYHHKTAEGSS